MTRETSALPLVMVTAYDAMTARIADDAGVDYILVGDSAATTVLGYATTREVSVGEMLMLTRAARRGTTRAQLIGDLPFGTYAESDQQACDTAKSFMDAGCDMVKLEGAGVMCDRVRALVTQGIPVVGHVGLLPQDATNASQLRARGRTASEALQIVTDARDLEKAGATLLVVEAVPSVVGAAVANAVTIPVIGIGAGNAVGGQVLVYTDLIGLGSGHVPRFVRQYEHARERWIDAMKMYANDVRTRAFPSERETYGMEGAELAEFVERSGALPRDHSDGN